MRARRGPALIFCLGLALPAFGEAPVGPNLLPAGKGTLGGAAQLAVAHQLYALGLARHDAQAVLAAAGLARAVTLRDVALVRDRRAIGGSDATSKGDGMTQPVDAPAMLASARRLAGIDEGLLEMVGRAEATHAPGTVTAGRTKSDLPAGHQDIWTLPFFGSAMAEITVIGDGDTSLDLRVTDETGAAICQSGSTFCIWRPAWNGYFTVTVSNYGSLTNSYVLLTN
jgi:hypothetical protein